MNYYNLYDIVIPDMTYNEVKKLVDKLNSQDKVLIKRKKLVNHKEGVTQKIEQLREETIPIINVSLNKDGKPRVLFYGNSKGNPYFMLESILGRIGSCWRENPIVCHGAYKLNDVGYGESLVATMMKEGFGKPYRCKETGRMIETDMFTGQIYNSKVEEGFSVIADILHGYSPGHDLDRIL